MSSSGGLAHRYKRRWHQGGIEPRAGDLPGLETSALPSLPGALDPQACITGFDPRSAKPRNWPGRDADLRAAQAQRKLGRFSCWGRRHLGPQVAEKTSTSVRCAAVWAHQEYEPDPVTGNHVSHDSFSRRVLGRQYSTSHGSDRTLCSPGLRTASRPAGPCGEGGRPPAEVQPAHSLRKDSLGRRQK